MSNKDNCQKDENSPQEEISTSPSDTSLHPHINKRETRSSSQVNKQKNKDGNNSNPIKQAPGLSKK